MTLEFPPTPQAARERLAAVDAEAYARTRNALDGAVTHLSPYLTHGLLDLPDAMAEIEKREPLEPRHKLRMEFGWREFFAHVWRHRGERIFEDLHPPLPGVRYSKVLPDDVLTASTGVAAIDRAVRELYATGYLHNHARLWLASYLVHLRKVHWRIGADWLYGHLLDGDLASNHLSWQWVAGTFSVKPYLFNAENVTRYAPPDWHSTGSVVDQTYEQLEAMARSASDCGPEALRPAPIAVPAIFTTPPAPVALPPPVRPNVIRLVHPWDLGDRSSEASALGVIHLPFHARFGWSARRWQFVLARMQDCCDAVFVGDLARLLGQLRGHDLAARDTLNPGYHPALRAQPMRLEVVPRFLQDPEQPCQSFSKFFGMQRSTEWHR